VISQAWFQRELDVIRASGVHEDIEKLLRPTANGRPRALSVDVFLAATMLSINTQKNGGTLVAIHRLLTTELSRSYRVALGVTRPGPGGKSVTIRQVRYMLERIELRLADDERRMPTLKEYDRQERRAALQRIADRILAATMPDHLPSTGEYALDASAISSWARGKRNTAAKNTKKGKKKGKSAKASVKREGSLGTTRTANDVADLEEEARSEPSPEEVATIADDAEAGRPYDPDARWGYQTKTFDKGTSFVFGYQAVALARVNYPGPKLVERLTLAPGNTNGVDDARDLVTAWQHELAQTNGAPLSKLLCDRGFSDALPERWKRPIAALGIEQVIDIHPTLHGVRDFKGVKMIDGTPHHPATPEHLWVINRPANLSPGTLKQDATFKERHEHAERIKAIAEFRAKIAERHAYAFRRVAGPDANGKERYECPGCAGKIKDPNCPISMLLPDGTPELTYPPGVTPQPHKRTMTVPGDATEKIRQRLYWGSDEWIAEYNKRGAIEGQFGNWKNPATEGIKRGWVRVVGRVKTTVMLVLAAAASNLRQLRAWADRAGDHADPKTSPVPKTVDFEELEPSSDRRANGPPVAA